MRMLWLEDNSVKVRVCISTTMVITSFSEMRNRVHGHRYAGRVDQIVDLDVCNARSFRYDWGCWCGGWTARRRHFYRDLGTDVHLSMSFGPSYEVI